MVLDVDALPPFAAALVWSLYTEGGHRLTQGAGGSHFLPL